MFIRKRIIAIVGAIAVLIGVLGGLAACSGSSGPQNATQILQSDGYTPSAAYTSALQSGLNGGDGVVTSSQAGTDNGNVQAVVVFDNSTDAGAGQSALQSQFGSDGITIATSGDVLTATGPLSAWAAADN